MFNLLGKNNNQKTVKALDKTRRTWFNLIGDIFHRDRIDDDIWDNLEELLITADVGIRPTNVLIDRLKDRVLEKSATEPKQVLDLLREEILSIVSFESQVSFDNDDLLVLLVIGINGVGKTTSIAKLASLYKHDGKNVILGASDTFRAAGVEQLKVWGERLKTDVIHHQPGSDPSAVAFDVVQAARNRKADVAIIDTAGRLHSKTNLMEELKKIRRVINKAGERTVTKVILTLDATTGQNGLIQARTFSESLDCDGVFLSKLDGSSKGGIIIAIYQDLKLPVLYVGTGETLEDIATFSPQEFVNSLFDNI